jgi:hypothetical protein
MHKRTRLLLGLSAPALIAGSVALSTPAQASTAQCDAVLPHGTCASWQSEVPGRPDLDVLGGAAVSGNSLIIFPQSRTDKAQDFMVVNVSPTATAKFTTTGVHAYIAGSTMIGAGAVEIEYAPKGVASGLCVSTVNPNGHADAQLRGCSNATTTFNQFQTFRSGAAQGDGTFIQFKEVINDNLMTNPANNGSVGKVGDRVHVSFRAANGSTGQLWGQNNT